MRAARASSRIRIVRIPQASHCANKQQGLKPPQETTCLFRSEIENKLTNTQTNRCKMGKGAYPKEFQNINSTTVCAPTGGENFYV